MTNKLATLTALAALALSPAVTLAQSPTAPSTTPPAATDPAAPPAAPAPAEKMPQTPATPTVTANTPKFVDAQASGQMLLNTDLIGADVVTSNDEKLGDISDILLEKDGKAVAAVIDVGGFLGIGAKPVAVSFDSLTMAPTDKGQKIVVAMSKDDLNNAPQFKTLKETRSASGTPSQ